MIHGDNLNRLITAALVSESFRDLLLTDPQAALEQGYNGEKFNVPLEAITKIATIRAENLPDFANELVFQFRDWWFS